MLENIFVGAADSLRQLFTGIGITGILNDFIMMHVKLVAILVFILINVMILVFMERKVSAYMQARIGPNRVGPKGSLQLFADIGKLLSKEITIPSKADKIVFLITPALIFVPALMILAVVPFGQNMVAIDMNIGLFYFLAIGSLSTVIFWASGWASNNKYSLLGGMRVVAQMVSYELPLALSLLGIVMITGTLSLSGIIEAQQNMWFIFVQPVAFLIFFIAAVAESNRTPFDLVEGESEIIAGPFTEYGGMAFAMFFLAEYASVFLVAAFGTIVFLGGWLAPFGWTFIPSWAWFFLKMYLLIFIIMQLRWTYPRIRVDQLMGFGWKVLVPLSLANIFITGIGVYIYRALGW